MGVLFIFENCFSYVFNTSVERFPIPKNRTLLMTISIRNISCLSNLFVAFITFLHLGHPHKTVDRQFLPSLSAKLPLLLLHLLSPSSAMLSVSDSQSFI